MIHKTKLSKHKYKEILSTSKNFPAIHIDEAKRLMQEGKILVAYHYGAFDSRYSLIFWYCENTRNFLGIQNMRALLDVENITTEDINSLKLNKYTQIMAPNGWWNLFNERSSSVIYKCYVYDFNTPNSVCTNLEINS